MIVDNDRSVCHHATVPTTATARRTRRLPGGGAPRVDWAAARAFYLSLGPERTYPAVSQKFGVSVTSIGKHARAEGWADAAEAIDRQVEQRALATVIRSREQQVAQTARIRDHAAERLERRLAATRPDGEYVDVDDALVLRAYEIAEKNVRLDLGEATEHVAVAEVQRILGSYLQATARYIAKPDRDAWLSDLDQATSGLVQLDQRGEAA